MEVFGLVGISYGMSALGRIDKLEKGLEAAGVLSPAVEPTEK